MGLEFAIEELYASGWSTLDTRGCEFAPDGRAYPSVARATAELAKLGFDLSIRKADLFDCFRAEWRETATGAASGAVVGQSEAEAAVYALAHARRAMAQASSA